MIPGDHMGIICCAAAALSSWRWWLLPQLAMQSACNANAFDELLAAGVMLLLELQASGEGLGLGGG